MTTTVANGWTTLQGFNSTQTFPGKILAIGGPYWSRDGQSGYSGFNGGGSTSDTKFMDDSRFMLGKAVEYLTGKTTGASALIMSSARTLGDGNVFGTQFADGLESHGHTYTRSLDDHNWSPYDPFDFDFLCMILDLNDTPTWNGLSVGREKFDYYMSQGGKVLVDLSTSIDHYMDDFGLQIDGLHAYSGDHESPDTPSSNNQFPVTGSKIYPGGTVYVVCYSGSSRKMTKGTDIMGGSDYDIDGCDVSGHSTYGVFGWWEG